MTKKTDRRRWGAADDARLLELRKTTRTAKQIASAMGFSPKVVQRKAASLGKPFAVAAGRPSTLWTAPMLATLRAVLVDEDGTVETAARRLGLTAKQVRDRLVVERDLPVRYDFDPIIREMWPDQTVTVAAIARRAGVDDKRVRTRAQQLGLKPRISQSGVGGRQAADLLRRVKEKGPPKIADSLLRHKPTAVAGQGAKALLDLGPRDCRFAVTDHDAVPGDHRFCGLPAVPGRSYCQGHMDATHHRYVLDETKVGAAALADIEAERRERVAGRKRAA